jgi:catalase
MTDPDREHLAANIIAHASAVVSTDVQTRVIDYWTHVGPLLRARVAAGLGRPDAELAVPPTLG